MTFATPEGLQKALALDGTQLQGQPLAVAVSHLEVAAGEQTAFVLNVAEGVDQAALEELLTPCGHIKSMRIPLDRETSKPRVRISQLSHGGKGKFCSFFRTGSFFGLVPIGAVGCSYTLESPETSMYSPAKLWCRAHTQPWHDFPLRAFWLR